MTISIEDNPSLKTLSKQDAKHIVFSHDNICGQSLYDLALAIDMKYKGYPDDTPIEINLKYAVVQFPDFDKAIEILNDAITKVYTNFRGFVSDNSLSRFEDEYSLFIQEQFDYAYKKIKPFKTYTYTLGEIREFV